MPARSGEEPLTALTDYESGLIGLDALIRHFNEHPEDRPLLATQQGVDLVNDILAQARAALTTPQRSHT